jgi:hypothetical protein
MAEIFKITVFVIAICLFLLIFPTLILMIIYFDNDFVFWHLFLLGVLELFGPLGILYILTK